MNFDRIAPFYKSVEYLVFGKILQKARCSQLKSLTEILAPNAKVLLIGDGDGRFLQQLLLELPNLEVTYIEHSEKMLQIAKERIANVPYNVRWLRADILEFKCQQITQYDLIVTHFLLDCFDREDKAKLISSLVSILKSNGYWLITDFDKNSAWWSRILVDLMYVFFKLTAGLRKCELIRPDEILTNHSLEIRSNLQFIRGFVYSTLWESVDSHTRI